MNYLKIVAPGFIGFTGQVGPFEFKDGISVDLIDRTDADRISASVECIAVDQDGNELASSPAERLIVDATVRAAEVEALRTASQEEMLQDAQNAALSARHSNTVFYTRAELEDIAKAGGIKALREKADVWSVRHRSIPVLIELIVKAQDAYKALHPDTEVREAAVEEQVGGRLVTPSSDPMQNITVDQLHAQQRSIMGQPVETQADETPASEPNTNASEGGGSTPSE